MQSLTAVSKYKTQLASIEQLSALLLCLEPIFDGDPIRQEIQDLNNDFQNLVLVLFGQLEVQVISLSLSLFSVCVCGGGGGVCTWYTCI